MDNKNLGKVLMYQGKDGVVELRADIKNDTIWATQAQISNLFEVNIPTINEHLKNIFKTGELKEISVIRKFRITAKDNKQYMTNFYNLDAIIAVGYRINSKKATQFRIWATGVLRDYLINGYVFNQYKLDNTPEAMEGLHEAIGFFESKDHPGSVKGKVTLKLTKNFVPKNNY